MPGAWMPVALAPQSQLSPISAAAMPPGCRRCGSPFHRPLTMVDSSPIRRGAAIDDQFDTRGPRSAATAQRWWRLCGPRNWPRALPVRLMFDQLAKPFGTQRDFGVQPGGELMNAGASRSGNIEGKRGPARRFREPCDSGRKPAMLRHGVSAT